MTKKEKQTIEENKKLCEEFPFLIPRNRFTDKIPEDYDYTYTELDDECPEGWDKLKINFYKEIKPILEKENYINKYRIIQSKEKWGYWHLYCNGLPEKIYDEYNDILRKYEKLSSHTCIFCGDENAKMTYCGWIFPCCKNCWESDEHLNDVPYEEATKDDDLL